MIGLHSVHAHPGGTCCRCCCFIMLVGSLAQSTSWEPLSSECVWLQEGDGGDGEGGCGINNTAQGTTGRGCELAVGRPWWQCSGRCSLGVLAHLNLGRKRG